MRIFIEGAVGEWTMDEIELAIPEALLDALPEDSADTQRDMGQAIAGWEEDINTALEEESSDEAVSVVVDFIEHFEERWEAYDEYVVELRAWGQSPIYAMAWRNLHASVIRQLYDHEDLAEQISRERNARIVDDGIRPG